MWSMPSKLYWTIATPVHLCIYGCFLIAVTEFSSCDKPWPTKPKILYGPLQETPVDPCVKPKRFVSHNWKDHSRAELKPGSVRMSEWFPSDSCICPSDWSCSLGWCKDGGNHRDYLFLHSQWKRTDTIASHFFWPLGDFPILVLSVATY